MISLACEHVNPSMSCRAKTVSPTTIAASVLLTVRKQLSSRQRSTLFAYKPVTTCTGTYERLVFSEQQGSDIQPEIACRGIAR